MGLGRRIAASRRALQPHVALASLDFSILKGSSHFAWFCTASSRECGSGREQSAKMHCRNRSLHSFLARSTSIARGTLSESSLRHSAIFPFCRIVPRINPEKGTRRALGGPANGQGRVLVLWDLEGKPPPKGVSATECLRRIQSLCSHLVHQRLEPQPCLSATPLIGLFRTSNK